MLKSLNKLSVNFWQINKAGIWPHADLFVTSWVQGHKLWSLPLLVCGYHTVLFYTPLCQPSCSTAVQCPTFQPPSVIPIIILYTLRVTFLLLLVKRATFLTTCWIEETIAIWTSRTFLIQCGYHINLIPVSAIFPWKKALLKLFLSLNDRKIP